VVGGFLGWASGAPDGRRKIAKALLRAAEDAFGRWVDKEKEDSDWLDSLPDCPCDVEDSRKASEVWHPPSALFVASYHPGADVCIRSKIQGSGDPAEPGQQCCYDKNGELITRGAGAGTPDKVSPDCDGDFEHIMQTSGHQVEDVLPFDRAVELDQLQDSINQSSKNPTTRQRPPSTKNQDRYREARPPNNGNDCPENPA
jgi:hypothetical protein